MEDTGTSSPVGQPSGTSTARPLPIKLTSLQPVPITSVWPTEPHHFTPWLLDNGRMLSNVLGIDIELEAREYKVGKFSLDVIGREVGTGTPVIIENQYGPTDHVHLGQLLTYAGGTKPTAIVWLAEQFREEHRAALEWLNAHTDPTIRFFGVRLAAVTLADAPPGMVAPFLELVVQPNDWEKRAMQAVAGSGAGSLTPTQELYRQFWSQFEPEAKARGWTSGSAPAQNWWNLPSGTTGATWSVSFAMAGVRSELFFDHPNPQLNSARWQALHRQRAEIEADFGGELIFDDLPNKKGCRIEARLPDVKIGDRDRWHDVLTWMLDTQQRLRNAIHKVGGITTVTARP
jgi:hypothetical protein